jgi:hypothetical protein
LRIVIGIFIDGVKKNIPGTNRTGNILKIA